MHSLTRLKPYILIHRWRFAGGFLALAVANYFALRVASEVGNASDAIKTGSSSASDFLNFAARIVGFTAIMGIFRYLMRQWIVGSSRDIELRFRNDIFTKLQSLTSSFYDRQRTGDLMARATNDVEQVRSVVGPGVLQFFNSLLLFPLALWQMVSIDGRLTAITMAPLLSLPFVMNFFGNRVHKRFRGVQDHYSHISAMVQENLAGVRVVKAFAQEDAQQRQFSKLNTEYIRLNLHLARIQSGFYPVLRCVAGTSIVLLLWIGGRDVITGAITIGQLVEFSLIQTMLFWPMIALGWTVSLLQRGTASMDRIAEIMDVVPDIPAHGTGLKLNGSGNGSNLAMQFINMTFAYKPGLQPALSDINITVPQGGRLGIVGQTGSGKSTLANLLARLYPVERGMLYVQGVDVNDLSVNELRSYVSVVFQETFLFSDSISRNIAFGVPDADPYQIREAASRAQIAEEIQAFPREYETMLGERGINLSGGQKQRTAIARALLRDSRILVLDDALSAVDTETEARILESLNEVFKGRTAIVISHRASAVMHCDEIIVLEEGRIVERGNHSELLSHDGLYADMFQKQLLADEVELEERQAV